MVKNIKFEIRKILSTALYFKKLRILLFFVSTMITTSSIFTIFSITATVKKEIQKDIENMGAYILELDPSIYDKDEHYTERSITYDDLLTIKRRCKAVKKIAMRNYRCESSITVIIEGKDKPSMRPATGELIGSLPDYKDIKCLKVIKGRFINELDIKLKRRVCVLGNTTYTLLGGEKVIGKKVKIIDDVFNDVRIPKESFTVIGVLARTSPWASPWSSPFLPFLSDYRYWFEDNGLVLIPYTTLDAMMKPIRPEHVLGFFPILIQIKTGKDYQGKKDEIYEEGRLIHIHKELKGAVGQILSILREKYGQDKKFLIWSANRILDELDSQRNQANIFMGTIGIITLIASISGIMSMMLLSVSTRTTEIGIRRAVGARKRDIFWQFLLESVMITAKGGLVGVVLGLCGVYLIGKHTSWEMVIPWYGIAFSLGIIGIIAVIGGIYPAMRASKIPPAQAVRYE